MAEPRDRIGRCLEYLPHRPHRIRAGLLCSGLEPAEPERTLASRADELTARAERAEAAEADLRSLLRDVGNHLSTEHEVRRLHDHLGENLGCAGCALLENVRAALFGPTDTEGAERGE